MRGSDRRFSAAPHNAWATGSILAGAPLWNGQPTAPCEVIDGVPCVYIGRGTRNLLPAGLTSHDALPPVRVDPGEPLSVELISEELQSGGGGAAAVGASNAAPGAPLGLREQLAEVERGVISAALARHGARKAAAAKELGLTRQGLSKKIERLGL